MEEMTETNLLETKLTRIIFKRLDWHKLYLSWACELSVLSGRNYTLQLNHSHPFLLHPTVHCSPHGLAFRAHIISPKRTISFKWNNVFWPSCFFFSFIIALWPFDQEAIKSLDVWHVAHPKEPKRLQTPKFSSLMISSHSSPKKQITVGNNQYCVDQAP